jgi:MFS family permease
MILMFFLSSRFGALGGKFGPRWFMAGGPIVAAIGFFTMLFVGQSASYLVLLPGILLFGIGLSITVAPLTAAVLAAISERRSGVASAVNNAISRIAGLIAVAALGPLIGQSLGLSGFRSSILLTVILMIIGGVVSAIGILNTKKGVSL